MQYRKSFKPSWLASAVLLGASLLLPASAADNAGAQKTESMSAKTCTNPHPMKADWSKMVVGFSQSESEQNPFRAAETQSVKDAAKAAGVARLLYANANDDQAKQVSDIQSMIDQGVNALIVAPLNSTGLQPALKAAREKGIPVVTIDRKAAGTYCHDFITFMGSDFYVQGQRAAREMVKATGGKAKIVELQGAYGNNVETARTEGFAAVIKKHPGMKIVALQTANWSTTEAQKVMSQILLAHPDTNALYTQSDTMALGAITAIRQFGKKPGKDIKIVSIDGTHAIVQDIADGLVYADIETNPRFGPNAFKALTMYFNGKPVHQTIIMKDQLYDAGNAKKMLSSGVPY